MNSRATAFVSVILSLVAIGALAPIASAHPLTAESYPARVFGEQTIKHVFTIEGGMTASCPMAVFEGKITEATGKVSISAEYQSSGEIKCSAFGLGGAASISTNGCNYELRPQVQAGEGEFSGSLNINCPEGQKITITSGTCEIQVGPQEGLGSVGYLNDPSAEAHKDAVTVKPEIEGTLRYDKTKDGVGCPLSGTGEKADGSYGGSTSLAGSNPTTKAPLDLSFANGLTLEAEAYPAELTGQQAGEHVFTFEGGNSMRCTEASFSGELLGSPTPTDVLLGAGYGGVGPNICLALKSSVGSVAMNGCQFRLRATAETEEGQFSGEADLDCPPEAKIKMVLGLAALCQVQIGDQDASGKPINQGLGPVTFDNQLKAEPEKDQLEVTFGITEEITYDVIVDAFTCPFLGLGTRTDGSYAGAFTLRAYSPATEEEGEEVTGEPYDLSVE